MPRYTWYPLLKPICGYTVILRPPNTGRYRQPWKQTWHQLRRQRSSQPIWALARLYFVWRDDGASFAVHPAFDNRHHGSPNAVTPPPFPDAYQCRSTQHSQCSHSCPDSVARRQACHRPGCGFPHPPLDFSQIRSWGDVNRPT